MIQIPEYVKFILDVLQNHGYEAYIVGGSVRDALRGKAPEDFDVTTDAEPEAVCTVFKGVCKVILTGLKHGTVTVLSGGKPVEVTTFRTDGDYQDNRHPESVTFVKSIDADLARRDFTVNAMAYAPNHGLVDLYGGQADLENKIIRCVGTPETRFHEDALRMLRALRFASVLKFEIEAETAKAVHQNRARLKNVSAERIRTELFKLLCGKDAEKILLAYEDVFFTLFPMLQDAFSKQIYRRAVTYACTLPANPALRFAAILQFAHSAYADACIEATSGLKTDRKTLDAIQFALAHTTDALPTDKVSVNLTMSKYDETKLRFLWTLKKADATLQLLDEIVKEGAVCRIADLDITGEEIAALGYKGRQIGETLNRLLLEVIYGRTENKNELLRKSAKKN